MVQVNAHAVIRPAQGASRKHFAAVHAGPAVDHEHARQAPGRIGAAVAQFDSGAKGVSHRVRTFPIGTGGAHGLTTMRPATTRGGWITPRAPSR